MEKYLLKHMIMTFWISTDRKKTNKQKHRVHLTGTKTEKLEILVAFSVLEWSHSSLSPFSPLFFFV